MRWNVSKPASRSTKENLRLVVRERASRIWRPACVVVVVLVGGLFSWGRGLTGMTSRPMPSPGMRPGKEAIEIRIYLSVWRCLWIGGLPILRVLAIAEAIVEGGRWVERWGAVGRELGIGGVGSVGSGVGTAWRRATGCSAGIHSNPQHRDRGCGLRRDGIAAFAQCLAAVLSSRWQGDRG